MSKVELQKKSISFTKLVKAQIILAFKVEFKYKINFLLTLIYFLTEFFIIVGIGLFIDYSSNSEIKNTVAFLILGVFLKDQMNSLISSFYQVIRNGYWSSQMDFFNLFPNGRLAFMVGDLCEKYSFSLTKLLIMVVLSLVLGILPDIKNPLFMILSFCFFMPTLVGIGLICASSFNLLNAKKTSPIVGFFTLIITMFSNTVIQLNSLTRHFGSFITFFFRSNPFFYLVEIIRSLNTDIINIPKLFNYFLVILFFNVFFLLVGINMYRESIKDAEINGSLSRWN